MAADIEPFYEILGRRIKSQRTKQRLTQEQLGSRLTPAMTRASIANIETGKQRVLAHTLIELAEALDVRLLDLVPNTTQKPPTAARKDLAAELVSKADMSPRKATALAAKLGGGDKGKKE